MKKQITMPMVADLRKELLLLDAQIEDIDADIAHLRQQRRELAEKRRAIREANTGDDAA